jgi:hypothetical protein
MDAGDAKAKDRYGALLPQHPKDSGHDAWEGLLIW